MILVEFVEELLGFHVGQQLRHVVLDHLGDVGGDHGSWVDDRITAEQRFFPVCFLDPHGGQAKRRFLGRFARQGDLLAPRIHDKKHVGPQVAAPGFDFLHPDDVRVGRQLHVVLYAHRGHHESDFRSHLASQGLDLIGQALTFTRVVDQGQKPVAELEPQVVDA